VFREGRGTSSAGNAPRGRIRRCDRHGYFGGDADHQLIRLRRRYSDDDDSDVRTRYRWRDRCRKDDRREDTGEDGRRQQSDQGEHPAGGDQQANHARLGGGQAAGEHARRADDRPQPEDEHAEGGRRAHAEPLEDEPERQPLESPRDEARDPCDGQRPWPKYYLGLSALSLAVFAAAQLAAPALLTPVFAVSLLGFALLGGVQLTTT
jgi:hypothetical protein